jgi:hypothetical protein
MDLGNIGVTRRGSGNPYRSGQRVDGDERVQALGRFLRGFPSADYEFWFCHPSGGARQIDAEEAIEQVDPDVVDYYWDDSGESRRRR